MTPKQKLADVRERVLSEYVSAATAGWCGCRSDDGYQCSCSERNRGQQQAYEDVLHMLDVSDDDKKKAIADYKAKYPQLFR